MLTQFYGVSLSHPRSTLGLYKTSQNKGYNGHLHAKNSETSGLELNVIECQHVVYQSETNFVPRLYA